MRFHVKTETSFFFYFAVELKVTVQYALIADFSCLVDEQAAQRAAARAGLSTYGESYGWAMHGADTGVCQLQGGVVRLSSGQMPAFCAALAHELQSTQWRWPHGPFCKLLRLSLHCACQ
jgi:hypothetical protein